MVVGGVGDGVGGDTWAWAWVSVGEGDGPDPKSRPKNPTSSAGLAGGTEGAGSTARAVLS